LTTPLGIRAGKQFELGDAKRLEIMNTSIISKALIICAAVAGSVQIAQAQSLQMSSGFPIFVQQVNNNLNQAQASNPITTPPTGPTGPSSTPPSITVGTTIPVPTTPTPPRGGEPRIPTIIPVSNFTDASRFNLSQRTVAITVRSDYQFVTESCSGLQDRSERYDIIASKGTLYQASGEKTFKLASGRMLVMAKNSAVTVKTSTMSAQIEPGSSAIIETIPNGTTHVWNLGGEEKSVYTKVSFQSGKAKQAAEQSLNLSAGQEVMVAADDLSEEELIPRDGIMHQPIQGSLASSLPSNVRASEFSLKDMQTKNLLLACRPLNLNPELSSTKSLKKVQDQVAKNAENQGSFSSPTNHIAQGKYVPISTMSGRNSAPKNYELIDEQNLIFAQRHSVFQKKSGSELNLELGSILVNSSQDVVVNNGDKKVRIAKGAIVLVEANGKGLKVVNFADRKAESVNIVTANQVLKPMSGQQVLISNRAPGLYDVFDHQKVAHRGTATKKVDGLGWVTASEVNLASAIKHHPALQAMRAASFVESKKAIEHITKTAAVLAVMHNSPEPFQTVSNEDENTSSDLQANCHSCTNGSTLISNND
jgi:hypothetical protein